MRAIQSLLAAGHLEGVAEQIDAMARLGSRAAARSRPPPAQRGQAVAVRLPGPPARLTTGGSQARVTCAETASQRPWRRAQTSV
jgi:hypothetical protein